MKQYNLDKSINIVFGIIDNCSKETIYLQEDNAHEYRESYKKAKI